MSRLSRPRDGEFILGQHIQVVARVMPSEITRQLNVRDCMNVEGSGLQKISTLIEASQRRGSPGITVRVPLTDSK